MIIIKIYSQDMYVASEVSVKHSAKVAKVLDIAPTEVFFISSEGTLVAEGVEQISWFTYLEVSLFAKNRAKQAELSALLQEIFANYGVHIMIKYDYVATDDVVKIINPDFSVFNQMVVDVTPTNYYDFDDEEDEEHAHDDDDDEDDDF